MKSSIIFLLLICTAYSFAQTGSSLILNEIMFYPSSGNNEFIEIYNTSTTESIDLDGFKIKYSSSSPDMITDAGEGTILNPQSYAVLFEADYDFVSGIYNSLIPAEALIIKITDNYFGSTGMANTADRPVWLLSAMDDTLDVYTYSADNTQTHSDEKIHFNSDSSQVNWSNSIPVNGTPGFRNSVTLLSLDLGVSSINISPEIPIEGDNISIETVIKNLGVNTADSYTISIFNDTNLDSIPQGAEQIYSGDYFNLLPADSVSAGTVIPSASSGLYNIIVRIYFTPDEDTSNNSANKNFNVYPPGTGYNDVVINEIMYAPSPGEPEWVEVYNRSSENINLEGWTFSDNSTTKIITDQNTILPAGSFIVLTKDSSILNYYSVPSDIIEFSLPALNNTGDAVVIKDSPGITIDSVFYLPDWGGSTGGRSLERISADDPGTFQSNWMTSESIYKATPGAINSATPKENDLKISSFKPARDYGIIGESVQLEIRVKNAGFNISPPFSISLFRDVNQDSIPQTSELLSTINSAPIAVGDSTVHYISVNDFDEGSNYFIVKLIAVPDDDTANNTAFTDFEGIRVNEVRNDLIVNEFMYDPVNPQPEWLEVFNRSNKSINLKYYRIADSGDTITVNSDDLFINPGQYAVIAEDSTISDFFNITCPLIVKSFSTLNNSGDKIILIDSLDRVIDSLEYSPDWGGMDGKSLERINSESPSADKENWSTSISRYNGTPGYLNSVTRKKFDISLSDIISSPLYPSAGDDVSLKIKVKNPGLNTAGYSINLYEDTNLDSLPDLLLKTISNLSLQAGDSSLVESGYMINNILKLHSYYAEAVFNPDMDTSNNYTIKNIFPGYPSSTIVINEIMYSPSGGEPEWVELYNTSGDSIQLKNWTVNDVITTPSYAEIKSDFVIPPKNYIVISRDSSILDYHRLIPSRIIILNLPVLNNDAEGFVLKDPRGQPMDSVYFRNDWGGRNGHSLERIESAVSSNLSSNWSSSEDIEFSTPGRINSITPKNRDIRITKISSEPEFPVEGDEVFISSMIKNKGSESASGINIEFYFDSDSDNVVDKFLSSQSGLSISPDDSLYIVSSNAVNSLTSGLLTAVKVISPDDEDTLNNYAERFIQSGFANRSVLINEIMYDPAEGEPEWFEIVNNSSESVNLKDWSAGDLLTTPTRDFITGRDFYLQPDQFAVVARDTSFYSHHPGVSDVFIANFGTLGNSEDGIILYDFREAVIDSVHYKSEWGGKNGRSLERISVIAPSDDNSNWAASLSPDRSTPGKVNSILNIPAGIKNSIVINEIMFDPDIDNCEFLEFYNKSIDSINIGGWRIEDDNGNFYKLSETGFLLSPGDYFLLAADSIILKKYSWGEFRNISFSQTSDLGLLNGGELILLKDVRGVIIDSIIYSSDWHNRNIDITKNKSLERINPLLEGNYSQNWSTSVNPEGATPGKQNSIFTDNNNRLANISVSPNPFSPDNDGFEDFSIINFSLSQATSQIRIKIFDNRGRIVRTLANNQPSASQGSIIFNGLGDDGRPLRMGIYIIFLEALNDNSGVVENLKTVVVVARKL